MQNFPHQISDLAKLYGALKVIDELVQVSGNIGDDEVLGVALAKSGVYAFRKSQTLEDALKKEKRKTRANRGTEAAARDLRRLFLLMGLLVKQDGAPSACVLTLAGKDLLAAAAGAHRDTCWRTAMLGLTLKTDNGSLSHPYRIIIRLVSTSPGIEKKKLLLALEAKDDSEEEFNRIVGLAKLPVAQIVKKLKVSKSGAANAIKILPSIAQQLVDITESEGMCFPAAIVITTEEGSLLSTPQQPSIPKVILLAEVDPENIAASPAFADSVTGPVDLAEAIALRKKRTIEHHKAVQSLARLLHKSKFKLYEYPYDCLAIDAKQRSILAEIKTLDGSPADERQQAERALGQLKGYRHFSVSNECKDHPLADLAAFTRRPAKSTTEFLGASGIHTTWEENGTWKALDQSGSALDFDPTSLF